MATSLYYTGQIPAKPLAITVYDSDGRTANLAGYTSYNVRMLGSNNEEIDLTGAVLNTSQANTGRFVLRWPTDRTLFEEPGEYLLQLELVSATARDYTTEHNIKVRRLGGKN